MSQGRRYLVLFICCLSLFIVGMDNTIVNVALPAIRTDLNASVSGLQWIIDAYSVVLASLLVLAGSTADRVGRRRIFQTGLALFTLGSLLCSVAPSLRWLVAFRVVQALGGCMLNPVAMSIITNIFTEPKERARAIGIWAGLFGVSFGVGPVLGGALTDAIGWRAIFWVNVPIGILALVLTALFVPESKAPRARRLDPVGQLLVVTALLSVTWAIIEGPHTGWASPATWGLFVLGGAAVLALVRYESRRAEPLIEVRFFRSPPFAGATVIAICALASFNGFLFLNTLYLQDVRHLSALQTGLCLLPMAVVTAVFAPLSGRLVASRGPRLPILTCGICMAAGALALTDLSDGQNLAVLIGCYVVFAFGFALVNAPITNTAVSGMPRAQAGVAAAIASTSRQVGGALGVAVVGSVVSTSVAGANAGRLAQASHAAWWILFGVSALLFLVGLVTTSASALQRGRAVTAALGHSDAGLEPVGAIGPR
ncbi:MAG: efflux rane protein [Frankiales bacterium]|nr:efflux rane protein [Frankiales bacterium]